MKTRRRARGKSQQQRAAPALPPRKTASLHWTDITGAVLGIFSKPEKLPRWRWQVVHQVLRRYRKRSSLIFLLRHGWWEARNIRLEPGLSYIYLILSGKSEYELKQLTGIYRALERETNKVTASAAAVEIARTVNLWEKQQQNNKNNHNQNKQHKK